MAGEERIQPTGGRVGGDPARLVERFADRVYRFLLAMTKDSETARDLTQETFLVLTVARNTALSWFRSQSVEKRHLTLVPKEELEPLASPGAADNPAREA
jgi:DNA-directed RNA polymerase specialized sigma24 family protein